jgi:hypothetical protein
MKSGRRASFLLQTCTLERLLGLSGAAGRLVLRPSPKVLGWRLQAKQMVVRSTDAKRRTDEKVKAKFLV